MKNYQQILESISWPTDVLVIDFETYFDQEYSLGKMSTIEFIMDDRFEFTGIGWWLLDVIAPLSNELSEPCFFGEHSVEDTIRLFQNQFGQNFEKVTVVAQNCKFDITILVEKFGINPPYVIDTLDLLRSYDARMSHKMKDVAPMFGLQPKGDTSQFKGLHYEDMDAETKIALEEYCKNDIDIEANLFRILLPLLSNPEIEIPVARHTLGMYLQPNFSFDFKKARSLKLQMAVELEQFIRTTNLTKKQLSSNLYFAETLIGLLPQGEHIPIKGGKPTKNMIKLLNQHGMIPALAKDDEGFQSLLVHSNQEISSLCKARQAVKSWPLHIKRINNMTNQADASGGKLGVPLHYYGGHTGRWSGGEKINLQNLGGRGRAGAGIHPLIGEMRSLLCAPDGYILGIADSAQIEARILAWLAGQDDLVTGFKNGEDIYSVFASQLFNSCVYKPTESDPEPIRRLLKIRRGFGKDAVLGCGYGMGANKFHQNCLANSDLRPFFDSGEYNFSFISRLINTYRTTYSKIPEFWTSVEKAFKWVIKYPHEQAQVSKMYDENDNAAGFRLLFYNKNGTVHLQLPSGRELTYRHCAIKKTTKGDSIRWHWGHLWGGSITENIVQAVARDLLAWWILEMENRSGIGYVADPLPVIIHIHDEIICLLHKDEAMSGLQSMLEIIKRGPAWADGLPLDAEGELSGCYKK